MTIRELAKLAGVSPAAVSFVLNNKPGVSNEKRKIIQSLLIENGYQLKLNGQKSAAEKQICLVKFRANFKNDEFSINILDAIEQSANLSGYQLNVVNINQSNYSEVLSNLDYSSISGIVFLASEFTHDCLKFTLYTPVPAVYVDIYAEYQPINTINSDQRLGSYLAAKHLHSLGHRSVGYLRCSPALGCLNQRFLYFKHAVQELGMQLPAHLVFDVDLMAEAPELQIQNAIEHIDSLPTAIFADCDIIASNCIQALQRKGLRVPRDISVIGFDNTKLSSLITPKITSIDIHAHEMGRLSVERLQKLIEDESRQIVHSYVSPSIIKRDSTGSAP